MSRTKIAVALIHGIGKQDPNFAEPMMGLLRRGFAGRLREFGEGVGEDLVLRPVYWAPVLQRREDILWERLRADHALDYLTLRQLMIDLAADGLAYQPARREQVIYDDVHAVLADAMRTLAEGAGTTAPLCCVAHSLGTVIASNYFYDLQARKYSDSLRSLIRDNPLEQGKTLTLFYTMGSPIAIWSLRFPKSGAADEFGKPIDVPSKDLVTFYPNLVGEWINFFDEDDIIAYPLRVLNSEYAARVNDQPVNAGNWLTSWNPASHLGYWTNNDVINAIVDGLVRTWKNVNRIGS
jgi:hypothetical protein